MDFGIHFMHSSAYNLPMAKTAEELRIYHREYQKRRRAEDPEFKARCKEIQKASNERNKEKVQARIAKWRSENKEHIRAYEIAYRAAHPEVIEKCYKERLKRYDPEKSKIRRQLNKEYFTKYNRVYGKKRRSEDPHFALKLRIRGRIHMGLKKGSLKSGRTIDLIGCTWLHLRQHLESLFVPGMTWENRSLWHIDHIRPIASFDLSCPAQQREAFGWQNMQPLWVADNLRKGAKWNGNG